MKSFGAGSCKARKKRSYVSGLTVEPKMFTCTNVLTCKKWKRSLFLSQTGLITHLPLNLLYLLRSFQEQSNKCAMYTLSRSQTCEIEISTQESNCLSTHTLIQAHQGGGGPAGVWCLALKGDHKSARQRGLRQLEAPENTCRGVKMRNSDGCGPVWKHPNV